MQWHQWRILVSWFTNFVQFYKRFPSWIRQGALLKVRFLVCLHSCSWGLVALLLERVLVRISCWPVLCCRLKDCSLLNGDIGITKAIPCQTIHLSNFIFNYSHNESVLWVMCRYVDTSPTNNITWKIWWISVRWRNCAT